MAVYQTSERAPIISESAQTSSVRPRPNTAAMVRIVLAPVVLLIGLVVLGLGITAPFIKDAEPQSAQWIADIVDHGHWLVPHDYYQMVMRKPPLFYWLSTLVTKAIGGHVDEVRARVVSLLAGSLLAAEVWAWATARLSPAGGWLSFVFLLSMYGFASRATTALTDMLMTLFLFSAYLVMMPQVLIEPIEVRPASPPIQPVPQDDHHQPPARSFAGDGQDEGSVSWHRTIAVGVLLGLGLLTKGPVTVALLALAVCFYTLLLRTNPVHLAMRAWPWAALAVGGAIAGAWYVPVLLGAGSGHLAGVFLTENIGHFLPASVGGTGEAARPVYYIGLRLVGGSLPLSLLIPALALAFILGGFAGNIQRQMLYQLAMAFAVLVLFSLASAKRDDYILPALPPLAIMFAALFVGAEEASMGVAAAARNAVIAASAAAMLLGTLAVFILLRHGAGIGLLGSRLNSSDESYAGIFAYGLARLTPPFMIFLVAVVAGAILALGGLYRARPMVSGAGLALLSLAASTLWTGTLKPIEASTRSLAPFAAEVRSVVGDAQVYVAYDDPEFAWYFGRGVPALPRLVAASGAPSGAMVYFVGKPRDLALIAPRVRRRMRTILQSDVLGGGGPPALYLFGAPG